MPMLYSQGDANIIAVNRKIAQHAHKKPRKPVKPMLQDRPLERIIENISIPVGLNDISILDVSESLKGQVISFLSSFSNPVYDIANAKLYEYCCEVDDDSYSCYECGGHYKGYSNSYDVCVKLDVEFDDPSFKKKLKAWEKHNDAFTPKLIEYNKNLEKYKSDMKIWKEHNIELISEQLDKTKIYLDELQKEKKM